MKLSSVKRADQKYISNQFIDIELISFIFNPLLSKFNETKSEDILNLIREYMMKTNENECTKQISYKKLEINWSTMKYVYDRLNDEEKKVIQDYIVGLPEEEKVK